MNDSRGRYYVKNTENGFFNDIAIQFDGVAVLKITGLANRGKPINIYTAQWINSQQEDFLITNTDENNNPVVIRENTDIELTFIVRKKYATNQGGFDVLGTHNAFVEYMTNSDVWISSMYMQNSYAHCVCLKEYTPTTVNLDRGDNSYMIGTITLHTLDAPVLGNDNALYKTYFQERMTGYYLTNKNRELAVGSDPYDNQDNFPASCFEFRDNLWRTVLIPSEGLTQMGFTFFVMVNNFHESIGDFSWGRYNFRLDVMYHNPSEGYYKITPEPLENT